MDKIKNDFLKALRYAVNEAGSQTQLARNVGMQQSRISDYLSERYAFDNITMGTLRKLFPELSILFRRIHPDAGSEVEEEMEKLLINCFRQLTPQDKIKYMIALSNKINAKTEK